MKITAKSVITGLSAAAIAASVLFSLEPSASAATPDKQAAAAMAHASANQIRPMFCTLENPCVM